MRCCEVCLPCFSTVCKGLSIRMRVAEVVTVCRSCKLLAFLVSYA